MQSSKPASTPLAAHFKLSTTLSPKPCDEHNYMTRVLYSIGVVSLIYAMVRSPPDLSSTFGPVSRYMTNLNEEHWRPTGYVYTIGGCAKS
ncbi:hypothetical protein FXO38_34770 [Capsicum annuum]|nr:hypothetical protein FXO38_34770 [Capsicum annuum]